MSARAMIRARDRKLQRDRRRRAKRVGAGAAAAMGAAAIGAPAAQAANFPVTNLNDDGAGSLRAAVASANLDAGPDTISFAGGLSGTIRLTTGEIGIESAMSIQGPGLEQVSISGDANSDNAPDAGDSRIFYVETDVVGSDNEAVNISGLTLTEGYISGSGGAIYSQYSNLALDRVAITDNYSDDDAGGVYSQSGTLTVTASSFTDNYAGSSGGGAIYTDDDAGAASSTLVVRDSTFADNSTAGNGGAIYLDDDTDSALIASSTISDNFAEGGGGGIYIYGTDTSKVVVQNSTISGNTAEDEGGGIYVLDTNDVGAEIRNSTIANNDAGADGTGTGGGIYRDDSLGSTVVSSTIVADNTGSGGTANDLAEDTPPTSPFTIGFSVVETPGTVVLSQFPAGSNLLGVDPQLGGLAANGGPTRTQLPAATSPVIDAGTANGLSTDQRGLPRTSEQAKANAPGSDGTDVGSVELATPAAPPPPDTSVSGVKVSAKKTQKQKGKKIKIKVKAGAAEAVDVLASGKVKAGKKSYPLRDAKADVAANQTETLTLKPKQKKAGKKIAKLLAAGKKAKATIKVLLTDEAANTASKKLGVKLKAAGKNGKKGKRG